jgi:outer membrane lipoprotein carrier protein
MLLSGQGRVDESFAVSDGGQADGLDWVVLVPKLEDTDFRSLRLGFRGSELVHMNLVDRLGQTTAIEFMAIERDPTLPAGAFTFVPPPGVDVVGSAAPR